MSNKAALKLYTKNLQYKCDRIIPNYYEDGENAFYMTLNGLKEAYTGSSEGNSKVVDKPKLERSVSTHSLSDEPHRRFCRLTSDVVDDGGTRTSFSKDDFNKNVGRVSSS